MKSALLVLLLFSVGVSASTKLVPKPGSTKAGGGGGTGLPDQTGHSGEFITTDGTNASWTAQLPVEKVTSGAGKYFTYKPNNVACTSGDILKWNSGSLRWECSPSVGTLANNTYQVARNAANTGDVNLFKADGSDNLYFGQTGSGHSIFFQGFDVWFTPDRQLDLYSGNNEFNIISSGSGLANTTSVGFSNQTQNQYFRVRAADSMSTTFTMIWPASAPTRSDQFMANDGSNQWSFKDIYDMDITITAGGTTGAQTIDKPAGRVNFAAAATSLVVTNSLVDTSTLVFATAQTNDATCVVKNVVPASGSFTINMTAGCTAETAVAFHIIK